MGITLPGTGVSGGSPLYDGNWRNYTLVKDASTCAVYGTSGPAAVYDAVSNKTFIAYGGHAADPYIIYVDHTSEYISPSYNIGDSALVPSDNHGIPAIAMDGQGYIHVFFGAHGGTMLYARSTNPRDITKWTTKAVTEIPIGTYPSVTYDPVSNFVYCLYRAGNEHTLEENPNHSIGALVKVNTAMQFTYIGPVIDVSGKYPPPSEPCDAYVMDCDAKGGRIHLTWCTTQGGGHGGVRENIYHGYYDPATNTMKNLQGTKSVASVVWSDHPAFLAYEKLGVNVPKHVFGKNGEVFIVFTEENSGGTWVDVCVAKWNGTAWSKATTGAKTSTYNHYQHIRVKEDGSLEGFFITGGHEIYGLLNASDMMRGAGDLTAYKSPDGVTWTLDQVIVRRKEVSGQGVGRCSTPLNAHPQLKVLYAPLSLDNGQPLFPLMGATNEKWSPAIAASNSPRQYVHIRPNTPITVLDTTTITTGTWNVIDMMENSIPAVPLKATEVDLRVTYYGNGTKVATVFDFRQRQPGNTGDPIRPYEDTVTFYGDYNEPQIRAVRTQFTEKTFRVEYKVTGGGCSRLVVEVVGYHMG